MKRLTAALCALLVLISGCTYAAVASRQEQESQTSALYAEKGSREKEDTERKIEKREECYE